MLHLAPIFRDKWIYDSSLRIEMEARWLACLHDAGWAAPVTDFFSRGIEACDKCYMVRPVSQRRDAANGLCTHIEYETALSSTGRGVFSLTLVTHPIKETGFVQSWMEGFQA